MSSVLLPKEHERASNGSAGEFSSAFPTLARWGPKAPTGWRVQHRPSPVSADKYRFDPSLAREITFPDTPWHAS